MSSTRGFILGFVAAGALGLLYGEQLGALADSYATQPTISRSTPVEIPVASEPPVPSTPQQPDPEPEPETEETEARSGIQQLWAAYGATLPVKLPSGEFPWQACFQRAAASYDLPQALLLAVARGESNFDPTARSTSGAVGLMQIRWPETSRHLGVHRERDLYNPCANVDAGARYLRELYQRFDNDWHLALAAYNYGPARVSAEQVPAGASWYSEYIFHHLLAVLGEAPGTNNLPPAPIATDTGKQQLMSFSEAYRAQAFLDYLQREVPNLSLTWAREPLGAHTVYLLYDNDSQRLQALQAIAANGVIVPGLEEPGLEAHTPLSF
jgi:hypothetical protein